VVLWRAGPIDRATKAVGVVIIVIMLLLLELPYRLMFHNRRPVVEYADMRCYELGRRTGGATSETLLYCPDWAPPRIRVLPADDEGLRETGERATVFERAR
jgi:hypothetical protein